MKTAYTFTDLKKRNLHCLDNVMGRHIYSNITRIKECNELDLFFKAPFRLVAKKTGDIGFYGSDDIKTRRLLINGIRLVKKNHNCNGNEFIEEEYYFPEKHPERFVLE